MQRNSLTAITTTDSSFQQLLKDGVSGAELAALSGSTGTSATKPVVFGGRVYNIPANETVEDAFGKASVIDHTRRLFQLKWGRDPVVVQPRTMAVIRATGRM